MLLKLINLELTFELTKAIFEFPDILHSRFLDLPHAD